MAGLNCLQNSPMIVIRLNGGVHRLDVSQLLLVDSVYSLDMEELEFVLLSDVSVILECRHYLAWTSPAKWPSLHCRDRCS